MNVDWLMGYIESRGSFNISNQRIMMIKKSNFVKSINKLDKDGLINLLTLSSNDGTIFIKRQPRSIMKPFLDILTILTFRPKSLSRLNDENLRELLQYAVVINPPELKEIKKFPRPSFTLNFHKDDDEIIDEVKEYFQQEGIRMYGPYGSKGRSKRLEVKGFEHCLKLHGLLAKRQWHTSKRMVFDEWGREMLKLRKKSV